MKQLISFSLVISIFLSCDKRLNEVIVKNNDIEVRRYQISEVTTMHDFIEVKRGASTIEVYEANSQGFADIVIDKDTIIIQSLPTITYKLADKVFDYTIKLDTTITTDYWREKVKERERTQ